MPARLKKLYQKLGRFERVFLILVAIYAALPLVGVSRGVTAVFSLAVWILGGIVVFRLALRAIKKAIWRLRNRLIVAYLFIAVVPIVLLLFLVGLGGWVLTGQVAAYLVSSELERRTAELNGPARFLSNVAPANRSEMVGRMPPYLHERFPALELLISGDGLYRYPETAALSAPPRGWKDINGVVEKDGRLFGWAHAVNGQTEVTLLAPLTQDFLAGLVPRLGDVSFLNFSENASGRRSHAVLRSERRKVIPSTELAGTRTDGVPPRYNGLDLEVHWISPITVAVWESPQEMKTGLFTIHTRPSAVLRAVFGQKVQFAQGVLLGFLVVSTLFLVVELVSLIIGVSITRTITRAVHSLYDGTQKVKEGDFSHRIEVHGNDQLAELSKSFNGMTENLQRLILIEKDQQRLQSELEIAREVQSQLFPKAVPTLKTLELSGLCTPARMVSGDYYDFFCLQDSSVALAIGDVAGKGISAALLMAAIQSIIRTQLTAGIPLAAAAGNGGGPRGISTAHLVAQLNKQLYANTAPEKYATFYFGLYDETSNVLRYTNAGHLPPILLRNGEPQLLEVTGTVVGAFPFSCYEEKQIQLLSSDLLIAYTDGISEPENEYGEMFGEERLKDLLVKYGKQGSNEIISRVMESVRQWTGSSEPQDDMTLLLARRIQA